MGCLVQCTSGIAKYTLFLLNFIILVAAIILIAFGASYKANNGVIDIMSVSSLAIAVGVFIACIAFFGCCGAVKESPCLLNTYAVILIVLLIMQVVLGALAFVAIKNDNGDLEETVRKELEKYYKDYHNHKDDIDNMQQSLECCGALDFPAAFTGLDGPIISCCPDKCSLTHTNVYRHTCVKTVTDFVEKNVKIIGGIAIGFAIFEVIAIVFACYVKSTRYE